ncbi:MAG TPA: hypothetical protein VFE50_11370 [Cyclobacteriaceae bacterium]|nr:hypothetical protein [Cyclobacteriaceae bacterium]
MPSWGIPIIIFLVVTTGLAYLALRKLEGEKLTRAYLLSITLKIFASCAFVITFILVDREGANSNAVFFLVGYVIFTTVEVIFLLLKKIS